MWQYIMKTNVKRLELFEYGLGAISSLQNCGILLTTLQHALLIASRYLVDLYIIQFIIEFSVNWVTAN